MKKMYLVLSAAVMAVSFSAFTTVKKAPVGNYMYDDGTGLVPVPPEINVDALCPQGNQFDCVVEINHELKTVFLNGNVYRWQ